MYRIRKKDSGDLKSDIKVKLFGENLISQKEKNLTLKKFSALAL